MANDFSKLRHFSYKIWEDYKNSGCDDKPNVNFRRVEWFGNTTVTVDIRSYPVDHTCGVVVSVNTHGGTTQCNGYIQIDMDSAASRLETMMYNMLCDALEVV